MIFIYDIIVLLPSSYKYFGNFVCMYMYKDFDDFIIFYSSIQLVCYKCIYANTLTIC